MFLADRLSRRGKEVNKLSKNSSLPGSRDAFSTSCKTTKMRLLFILYCPPTPAT